MMQIFVKTQSNIEWCGNVDCGGLNHESFGSSIRNDVAVLKNAQNPMNTNPKKATQDRKIRHDCN